MTLNVKDLNKIRDKFDFIFEWAILHHIMPENRESYLRDIKNLLNNSGKYLSICFNNQNPDFGMKGVKLRILPEGVKMPSGTKLYYSSFEEMENLFKNNFKILDSKLIKMTAGGKDHIGNYFLLEKKE